MSSIIFFITFFLKCLTAAADDESLNCFGRIAINCGSSISNMEEFDGINWIKDVPSKYTYSPQLRGSSTSSSSMEDMMNVDHVPYRTARISRSEFSYMFQVNSGQIFIGLHFNPASYRGFKKYEDFFTVEAGNFTLLSNFSASLNADFLGVKYFVKKFYMIVEENQNLTLKFTPVSNAYAFVNGVEIIPLSSGHYYTHDDDLGAQVIGQKSQIFIDNSTGLELVHRSNIRGNSFISSGDDFNMFRSAINTNRKSNMINDFTWNVPVDVGFGYLVRLYFSEVQLVDEFSIYIDGMIANIKGVPVQDIPQYRDYVVMMKGHKQEGKRDLSISLQFKGGELSTGPLKGFEVLKMSNPDNSLASSNPLPMLQASPSWTLQKFILLLVFGNGYTMSTITIVVITVLNTFVYMLRQIWGEKSDEETNSPLTSMEGCRRFSFAQILSATKNFSDEFVIGRGGFGKVYKGFIDKGQQVVALKRLNSNSKQGALEFWTEVETLSTLRHVHLVSLIGYCNENQEMILVYEYMPHGTLAEHLYKLSHESNNSISLSWVQRLKICVGAARGLDYLHTGTDRGVIHRDVKSSNILLDENFVAKISDFGLAKVVNEQLQSYVSTNVKGTFGYLDPHYFVNRKITRKTDVYAFGVVLLEVLSGRLAVNSRLPESQRSLTGWATKYINKGETSHIIDPNIKEQISPDCLKIFVEISEKCLHIDPKIRPTMANLVVQLEFSLALQGMSESSMPRELSSTNEVYPCTDETIQSSDVQNVSIRPKVEANKNLLGILVVPFRKKISGNRIPTLKLSWEVFWKKTKVPKNDNLLLPDVLCPRFTISEILAATNNFDENLIITSDSFYTVYEGFLPTKVAIERVRYAPEDKIYKICREIGMLSKIKHRYLASLIGYCYHEGEIIIVYDYVGKATLSSYLYKAQFEPLPWKIRLQICITTAKGLRHLHAGWPMIYHRDVRPANIFLDNNLVPKLLNFGFSYFRPVVGLGDASTTLLGGQQYAYLPPEFFRLRMWTEKSDVYSFGLILLEVICGTTAINHDTDTDFGDYSYNPYLPHLIKRSIQTKTLHETIDQDLRGKIAVGCLNEYIKVALSCLLDQPTSRPSMDKVVECLELASEAQETVEVMSETNIKREFVHSSGSNLENMYQELSCLASENPQQSHPGLNDEIFTSTATFDFGDSMSR